MTITQQGFNLTEVTTTYQYDAFGRRISKHSQTKEKTRRVNKSSSKIIKFPVQQQKTEQSQVYYLWDGNRQLQEQTDTHIFTTVYEQNSFEPVARLVWLQDGVEIAANEPEYQSVWEDEPDPPKIKVYHCHNDHLGTPNELTNQDGEVVWLADYEAWGNTAKVVWREEQLESVQVSSDELQPLRFQGQFIDQETGLHYNRFRYFDPDLGMFTTRDPIGLMGGSNVFQYAPNPTGWVDPWGLAKKPCAFVAFTPLPKSGHLYRGVSANHPAIEDERRGIARPALEQGGATATQHNAGGHSGNSSYTSWTDKLSIARTHANKDGPGGVILSAPFGAPKPSEKWSFEISDDIWGENERLISSTREGLGVHDPCQ